MGSKNNPGKFDCLSKADPDEPMFVLLGRDPAAPILINLWADIRSRMGEEQEKIEEACACAETCTEWLATHGKFEKFKAALVVAEECMVDERIKQLETENQELLEEVTRLRLLYDSPHLIVKEALMQKENGK